MEQPAQIMPMTKDEFWKKFWFSPMQMVTLINPKYDYTFMVEGRNFMIKAGATEKMPGTVANVYLSQMTRIMAQDDDKMQFLSDFAFMRQYYDKLIVDVESLINEVSNLPAYLNQVPESMKTPQSPETPPWQSPTEVKPVKESTKEFEYEGAKFKMTVDKNDKENFFKNGTRISAADYAKAASMI